MFNHPTKTEIYYSYGSGKLQRRTPKTNNMPRLNAKSVIKDFNLTIEELEQAEKGIAHDGTSIAEYEVKALLKVAERLGILQEIKTSIKPEA